MKLVDSACKKTNANKDQVAAKPTPATAKTAANRQLKDYPQSLQTAARALWG